MRTLEITVDKERISYRFDGAAVHTGCWPRQLPREDEVRAAVDKLTARFHPDFVAVLAGAA